MKRRNTKIITQHGKEIEAMAPMILSVSRATDVPAFYSEWFFNSLKRGYCRWRNPFNGADNYVSLNDVRFIVFWSKNPKPLISHLSLLKDKGINCYIQYTLNDYEREGLEPGVPGLNERTDCFKELVDILGFGCVVWRFDPLILADKISSDNLIDKVGKIGNQLKGYTEKLVFSFADIASYRKVSRNLMSKGISYIEWNEDKMHDMAQRISLLNKTEGWNYRLATCGERIDLTSYGIIHNRCVDDELISRIAWSDKDLLEFLGIKIGTIGQNIFGESILPDGAWKVTDNLHAVRTRGNRDSGQRKYCGCIASKDIGQYNTCPHGCLYCYANSSPESARENFHRHNPVSELIIG